LSPQTIINKLESLSKGAGYFASLLLLVLIFLVAYDVVMRYTFSAGSIALQEIEWHIFATLFLIGIAYALQSDSHVRVDIFYTHYSDETKLRVQIISMVFLVIPFGLMIAVGGWDMALQSYIQREISSDPGGLTHRYLIKGMVVVAFVLLVLQALAQILKAYSQLTNKAQLFKILSIILLFGLICFLGLVFEWDYLIEPLLLMFFSSLTLLMMGFEVAFVFAGVALFFALITRDMGFLSFEMLPYRIYGIMDNTTLMAIPLFIFMGLVLEKSNMAQTLLVSMGKLFGPVRGGLAISVVIVGAILAASMGIVGASVVMMSLIALPLMLKHRYSPQLASGTIAASGTLGQIIPPSIVLIILGDQMHLSAGELFKAAVVPGLLLVVLYILYILVITFLRPQLAPAIVSDEPYIVTLKSALRAIMAPFLLIAVVLGSIFSGVASATESAAIGALGAMALAWHHDEMHLELLKYTTTQTVKLTAMIFMILIGATAFSFIFHEFGGGDLALQFFSNDTKSVWLFVLITMVLIFFLGFFIDFIEIAFVVVPILVPVVHALGIDPIWFAILIALNLQTSFLTPPFGFALFYLKGAAGEAISTATIYRGVIPFILLQIVAILIVAFYPDIIYLFGK